MRAVASDDEVKLLCDKVSKGLDKYLKDAKQHHALEINYFDDTTRPINTSLMSEGTEQVNESSKNNLPSAKQKPMEEVESAANIPESPKIDTSHTSQCQPVLRSTSQCGTNTDENHQQHPLQDQAEHDTEVCQDDDEYSAKDVHYVVAITTPPNIVLRENMILMTLWRR